MERSGCPGGEVGSKGSHPEMNNDSIEKHFMEGLDKPGAMAKNVGDAKKALSGASKKIEATYFVPFVAHATMEPMNCTAHVQKDRCDVWAPTQAQILCQSSLRRSPDYRWIKSISIPPFSGAGLADVLFRILL